MAFPDLPASGVTGYLNDLAASIQGTGPGSAILETIEAHPVETIFLPACAVGCGLVWAKSRRKRLTENFVRNLGSIEVESPFEDNATVPLREVFYALARTDGEMVEICRSYGIELPKKAFAADGGYSLEDIVRKRRRLAFRAPDRTWCLRTFRIAELCGEGHPLPVLRILPRSRLALMRAYLRGGSVREQFSDELYQQAVERAVREKIEAYGYRVLESEEYFAVSRRFFEKTKMPFVPCPQN
ncbi:MAG: hypothetical protein Q4F72_09510 [Desulfovibrionaceae bacterium]|nr:hypothetical protein [Desulfovibrionaceae bacterium]